MTAFGFDRRVAAAAAYHSQLDPDDVVPLLPGPPVVVRRAVVEHHVEAGQKTVQHGAFYAHGVVVVAVDDGAVLVVPDAMCTAGGSGSAAEAGKATGAVKKGDGAALAVPTCRGI